jgi:tRNA(adenine34) deaminase
MLFSEENYKFMFAALQEAEQAYEEEEVPVGAVVVNKGKIIGKGRNQIELLKDPTAHAEIIALSAAGNFLRDWRLNQCDMYVTLEPCVMCTGALLAARINNLYFATYDPKYGACGSIYNLAEEGKYNHKIKIFSGIYSNESTQLLKNFFGNIRKT